MLIYEVDYEFDYEVVFGMLCFDNNTYVKLHDDAYDYI